MVSHHICNKVIINNTYLNDSRPFKEGGSAVSLLYSAHLHDLILKNDFHNNKNVFELNKTKITIQG